MKNPPAIVYNDLKFPESISNVFPDAANNKYSNGVISFSNPIFYNLSIALFPTHVNPKYE